MVNMLIKPLTRVLLALKAVISALMALAHAHNALIHLSLSTTQVNALIQALSAKITAQNSNQLAVTLKDILLRDFSHHLQLMQ